MSCGINGTETALYIEPLGAPHTFDSSSERYEFLSESLSQTGTILYSEGIRGTRSQEISLARRGPYAVGGAINMNPSPDALGAWLVRALGGGSVTAPAIASTVPFFGCLVNRVADTYQYSDCKVNTLTLRGSTGGLLEMTVNVVGMGYVEGTSAPSVSLSTTLNDAPLAFTDLVFSLASTTMPVNSFELTIDNQLAVSTRNSLYPICLREQDRVITLRCNMPFNTTTDDFEVPALTGIAAVLTFTNSTVGATINLPYLQKPPTNATIGGKNEVNWDLDWVARASGANAEITCTVDSTV